MLAPTFTAVKPAETANPFSPVASVKAPRDSYQTSSQNAGFQSWKADEQHFKAFRLQMQQRNGSSNSFSGDLFKNARNGTETFGGPPSTPSGQKANARTVSPGEGPAPLSWIDNLLFVIQSQASPLSEGNQELLAIGINNTLPEVLKAAGVDFGYSDEYGDGRTYTKNGKVYMRINSNLNNQDKAMTILHECRHVPTQSKVSVEADKLKQTNGALGNPFEVMWQDEISAYKLQGLISLFLVPQNGVDARRARKILLSFIGGKSVEGQLMDSPYREMYYDNSQKVKRHQGK
jgi:hypothetical protein